MCFSVQLKKRGGRLSTVQVELHKVKPKRMKMQGVVAWQQNEDVKQSIGDERPCPGLMAHNEAHFYGSTVSHSHCH